MEGDVAVVGGGFAGVTAARDLRDAGLRVVLLEARDRLGGRTWYRELPGTGVQAEYGGEWFSREAHPALAAEMERYAIATNPSLRPTSFAWLTANGLLQGDGVPKRWDRALAALDDAWADAAKRIGSAIEAGDPSALAELDISATDWIRNVDVPEETARGSSSRSRPRWAVDLRRRRARS